MGACHLPLHNWHFRSANQNQMIFTKGGLQVDLVRGTFVGPFLFIKNLYIEAYEKTKPNRN